MLRTTCAVAAGKAARLATRLRGGGSALPGLVAERIDPGILAHALSEVSGGIVVVTGTNGKTTTTKMLASILRAHGKTVFSNPTGSNFTRGVISSLLADVGRDGKVRADLAVIELDEAHAIVFADAVTPTHALLLNVARDQLDRFAEIDYTAGLLARLAARVTKGVVLNRDDSFVSRIAVELTSAIDVRHFGVHPDIVDRLPELLEADLRSAHEATVPDLAPTDGLLRPIDEREVEIVFADQTVGPLTLQQRGLAAMINATAATTMARELLGEAFRADVCARALAAVRPPFGRGEVIDADGAPLELVLVKNPAAFTAALGTYAGTGTPVRTMIAINDDYADGRDVSWLYDVSFDVLGRPADGKPPLGCAVTSGVRAYDMALRLAYDDIATDTVEPDLDRALTHFLSAYPTEPKRIFTTYTAMLALRRLLSERYDLPPMGEDAS